MHQLINIFRLFIITASVLLMTPVIAFAQEGIEPRQREEADRRQNVLFYDVNPREDVCYGGSAGIFETDLYFLGDSIGVGMAEVGNLRDNLPNSWAVNINARESRTLAQGQEVLEDALQPGGPAASARITAVELGTNTAGESATAFQNRITDTVEQIRAVNPQTSIVWLDSPTTSNPSVYSAVNQAIRDAASENNFEVFSLFDIAYPNNVNGTATAISETSSNDLAASDNIHLTSSGYSVAAGAFADYLEASASAAPTGGATGTIRWPDDLDPEWIRIWTSVGAQYGVDPKILAAIFTSEHGGNFYPITGDGGSAANGGWAQPSSSTATGPFQFLNDAYDWVSQLDPSMPPRTDRGPSDPRNDPVIASRAAAIYLRFMGAPEGLPAGSSSGQFERASYGDSVANTDSTRDAETPWTVAGIAARYNQGPWWDFGTVQGNNNVVRYMDTAVDTYLALGGQDAVAGLGTCTNTTAGSAFVLGDYAFPIEGPHSEIQSGYSWPCPSICHHDATAAFDLSHEYDDSSIGVAVYAITDGRIENFRTSYRGEEGCNSYQIVGTDGWHYWYGHTQALPGIEAGLNVTRGQQVAVIGERRCTGNGSYPHLHIDRGFPQGRGGGSDCCRDEGFVPLINELYENYGSSPTTNDPDSF